MVETTWRHVSGRTLTDEQMHEAFEAFYDGLRGPVAVGGVGDSTPSPTSISSTTTCGRCSTAGTTSRSSPIRSAVAL